MHLLHGSFSHNGAQIEFAVVVKIITRETLKIRELVLIFSDEATHQDNVIRRLGKIPMLKLNSKMLQCKRKSSQLRRTSIFDTAT